MLAIDDSLKQCRPAGAGENLLRDIVDLGLASQATRSSCRRHYSAFGTHLIEQAAVEMEDGVDAEVPAAHWRWIRAAKAVVYAPCTVPLS